MRKSFNEKEKWCNRCKVWLGLDKFRVRPINRRCISGREAYCRKCANEYNRKYYTTEKRKNSILKHRYGVDKGWFDSTLLKQKNKCIICGDRGNYKGKALLVVDHNHKTGQVRGLLCHRCNVFVGYLEANPGLVIKVKKYLKTKKCLTQ